MVESKERLNIYVMKKILFVCQYFYPETFRGNDVAFHLAEEGHEVHVVTGIPNYPAGKFYSYPSCAAEAAIITVSCFLPDA